MHPQMPTSPPILPQGMPPSGWAPIGGVEPPPPAPPPAPARRRRWPWIVVAVAVLVVLALLGLWLATRDRDPAPETSSPSTSPTAPPNSAPAGPPLSPPPSDNVAPIDPAELNAAVDDAIAFIEATRNAKFVSRPDVEALSESEFQTALGTLFDADLDSLRTAGELLTALGLIEPGTDIVEAERSLLGAGVLGFYDPKSKRLVVRSAKITTLTRVIIVHELTHALDDQLYGLDRPELDETGEAGFGFRMLAEGSGRYVENEYRSSLLPGEQAEVESEETDLALEQTPALLALPPILLILLQAPYPLGESIVREVVARGGVGALGSAFADPPTTSEQGFLPPKFFAGEGAAPVDTPPADGAATDDGALGALILDSLMGDELSQMLELGTGPRLDDSVEGWGGDHYVVWTDDAGAPCVRFDVKMDNATERDDLKTALDGWSRRVGAATVENLGADSVRSTRCATASAGGESPA